MGRILALQGMGPGRGPRCDSSTAGGGSSPSTPGLGDPGFVRAMALGVDGTTTNQRTACARPGPAPSSATSACAWAHLLRSSASHRTPFRPWNRQPTAARHLSPGPTSCPPWQVDRTTGPSVDQPTGVGRTADLEPLPGRDRAPLARRGHANRHRPMAWRGRPRPFNLECPAAADYRSSWKTSCNRPSAVWMVREFAWKARW